MAAEKEEKRAGFVERRRRNYKIRLLAVIKLQFMEDQVD